MQNMTTSLTLRPSPQLQTHYHQLLTQSDDIYAIKQHSHPETTILHTIGAADMM